MSAGDNNGGSNVAAIAIGCVAALVVFIALNLLILLIIWLVNLAIVKSTHYCGACNFYYRRRKFKKISERKKSGIGLRKLSMDSLRNVLVLNGKEEPKVTEEGEYCISYKSILPHVCVHKCEFVIASFIVFHTIILCIQICYG